MDEKSISADLRKVAVSIKLDSLTTICRMDAAAEPKLQAFVEEIRKGEDKKLIWGVDGVMLQFELSKIKEMPKPDAFKEQAKKLIDHVKKGRELECLDPGFLNTTVQVIMVGEQILPTAEATAMMKDLIAVLDNDKDENVKMFRDALTATIQRLEIIGKPFDFTFKTLDGKEVKTTDLKDKLTLIVFWSVTDQGSLEEIPYLVQLYEAYHEKGLEVIAVSCDPDTKELRDVLTKVKFTWTTVLNMTADEAKAAAEAKDGAEKKLSPAEKLGVTSLPTKILVGKDGKVTSANIDILAFLKVLEEAYGPMPAPKAEDAEAPSDAEVDEALDEAVEEEIEVDATSEDIEKAEAELKKVEAEVKDAEADIQKAKADDGDNEEEENEEENEE